MLVVTQSCIPVKDRDFSKCLKSYIKITDTFAGPIVAMLAGQLMSCARSIIFKTVSSSETGKINALLSSLDSLTPLLATPVYSFVYSATFENMPGAFFLLSAVFAVPPIVVFWYIEIVLLAVWFIANFRIRIF